MNTENVICFDSSSQISMLRSRQLQRALQHPETISAYGWCKVKFLNAVGDSHFHDHERTP